MFIQDKIHLKGNMVQKDAPYSWAWFGTAWETTLDGFTKSRLGKPLLSDHEGRKLLCCVALLQQISIVYISNHHSGNQRLLHWSCVPFLISLKDWLSLQWNPWESCFCPYKLHSWQIHFRTCHLWNIKPELLLRKSQLVVPSYYSQ